MRSFLVAILVLSVLHSGLACPPTPPPPPAEETTKPAEETTAATTPKDDSCASKISDGLEPAGKNGYKDGGPVEKKNKLKFKASESEKACWKNKKPPADELEFAKIDDASKLAECEGAEPKPQSGPAMIVYSGDGSDGKAMFHSCSVLCSDGPPKVKVKGSKSKDVKMKVCHADSFTSGKPKLKNCKPVKFGQKVKLGNAKRPTIYDIVIVAEGFKKDTFAAIQEIDVDFKKCKDEKQSDAGPCSAACSFDGNTCAYKKDAANAGATELKAYETKTIVGNLDSGVNARLDGNPSAATPTVSDSTFLAAPQNPGDKVVSSTDVDVKEDLEMTFDVYEACDGNAAKVCFDTPDNCPYEGNPSVAAADRQWQKQKVKIPKGTKKIFLEGDNSKGKRFCATGFKNVNFQKAGSDKPLCDTKAKAADTKGKKK